MTVDIIELENHSYIDHELSSNLDSTDAFEGPEKLLEIWFYPTVQIIPNGRSLLDIEMSKWIDMLNLVKCEILSMKKTPKMYSFLLSESSMFVYDHRIILKTCGTTLTLLCLPKLFELVQNDLKWDFKVSEKNDNNENLYSPYKVFYSRRSFMFPDKQKSVHKNWSDEVDYLNKFFINGESYVIGEDKIKANKSHWNLYVTKTKKSLVTIPIDVNDSAHEHDDETFEILMTGLSDEKTKNFYKSNLKTQDTQYELDSSSTNNTYADEGHVNGYTMTKQNKIDEIYESFKYNKMTHDAFAFSPCGYSSNVLINDEFYYTLHVTPENGWSYASFESNVQCNNNSEVLRNVLEIFKPTDFCLTFFRRKTTKKSTNEENILLNDTNLTPYEKLDEIVYDLDDYQLLYIHFQDRSNLK
ncbi:hypothetical protein TPHA_0G01060 [Tetrapisispora phaffii CBS 4417]|uniref:adenosylmethionine decarboxylase n=1 Tax=Tetrapisispora phaffii (strain ATCC 24235 / CBS 4417 / NBRC 1672 / NRRL Y-8282 / UCD 70-5) TaxID=1071381 RepID=G8BVL5_TETPH|nr:hypothetical protein TPHA_0G01060 [Tetrapisispora phaffii CBS 4417]CCE63943.1 hypothetical protein TPHA_0G01060 [Tetrapisispora phaffii CBS 4417]